MPRRQHLLIVDDHVDAATGLAKLLRSDGHEAHAAHDGQAALELAEGIRPDAILLDIGLPDMDGYEVACRLRERWPSVRLLALTGYRRDEQRLQEAGFDDHLLKPIDLELLKQWLARRQ